MIVLCAAHLRFTMPRLSESKAAEWAEPIAQAANEFEVNTARRLAAFLAQVAHESGELSRLVENLSYSAERLRVVWPSRFPTAAIAAKYARRPEALANRVYSGRLGNGPESSGDGWRFRGRGLMQITGRFNYRDAGLGLGLPLEDAPELLESPLPAARAAGHYWQKRGLNVLADSGTGEDFAQITRRINGGMTGHAERTRYWARAKQALGA